MKPLDFPAAFLLGDIAISGGTIVIYSNQLDNSPFLPIPQRPKGAALFKCAHCNERPRRRAISVWVLVSSRKTRRPHCSGMMGWQPCFHSVGALASGKATGGKPQRFFRHTKR
jgi:hypothetical protein